MQQTNTDATISLREVVDDDLPIFYDHQNDPVSNTMAGVPARDHAAFLAHWQKIRTDPIGILRTILLDGEAVGVVLSFLRADKREVGYWIGREHWGKGIATAALQQFVTDIEQRALHAYAVKHNTGSQRVLEKCGFTMTGEDDEGYLYERPSSVTTTD